VVAEDLSEYGFDVSWDGTERSLSVSSSASARIRSPQPVPQNMAAVGSVAFPYVYSDIVTYLDGNRVESFNIHGRTVVLADDVSSAFGGIYWSPDNKALSVNISPEYASGSTLVWLSATGSRWHRINSCGPMNPDNARQVTLGSVRYNNNTNFGPCENCHPPR
jgi:hypothetical protein